MSHRSSAASAGGAPGTSSDRTIPRRTYLYVIRHGETSLNAANKMRGWVDVPLTRKGITEAHMIAVRLKGKPLDVIVTSDLRRARQTADIIAKALWKPVVESSADFRPMHIGEFSGRESSDWPELYDYIRNHPDRAVPGGESFNTFKRRYLDALIRLLTDSQYADASIAVVAHHRNERLTAAWADRGWRADQTIDVRLMGERGCPPGRFVTYPPQATDGAT